MTTNNSALAKTFLGMAAVAISSVLMACNAKMDSATTSTANGLNLWPKTASPEMYSEQDRQFVRQLMAKMTIEEKVGQLLQAEIQTITPQEVRDYHIGSVLNGGGSTPHRNPDATAADWAAFADAFFDASMDTSDGFNAIPIFWGTDAVHGHGNLKGATIFPHNIGLGATRNPELIEQIGRATAREVRASGIEWVFAPTVAVARNDRWGRSYEAYSEEPTIVASYAGKMVEGLQGKLGSAEFLDEHHVAATAKHFLADGGTVDGDDQGDARVSEQTLVQIHNPGYVTAIEAGVQSIMASFNEWNGVKMHGNSYLLNDVLKQQMGFDGFVVGDWNGHGQVPGCTNIDCPESINAGVDHIMVPYDWKKMYPITLAQAKSGEIPTERIDQAVERILLVKKKLGLFSASQPSERALGGDQSLIGHPSHRATARQAVRESLVLLKNNDSTLPIRAKQHILVTGPGADNIPMQSGGWSVTWQGTGTNNASFPGATSIYRAIVDAAAKQDSTVELVSDYGLLERRLSDGDKTATAIGFQQQPDVAIVVFGETPYAEGQGDINTLEFEASNKRSLKLLKALKAKNIPVVSLFISGRPLWTTPEINASDAFVATWLPGSEAQGIADVLFTDSNNKIRYDFRGKLSFSWPKTPLQFELNVGDEDYDPLFAFGYGLNYDKSHDKSYAQQHQLPLLDEDVAGVTNGEPQDIHLYRGRPLQPWHIVIDNQGNNQLLSGAFARLSDNTITVTTSDKDIQEDALTVAFNEAWNGAVYMSHGAPLNLQNYLKTGALSFDFNSLNVAKAGLQIALSCGENCENLVDLWPFAKAQQGKAWQRLTVPLSCFQSSKSDFSAVAKPFALKFYGTGEFSFANISLVLNHQQQDAESTVLNCPNQETLAITPAPLRAFWADDWWMSRHQHKLHAPEREQAQLLMIGDSITHGWEDAGKAVWQQHFSDVKTFNIGFGGNRTENVLWHFEQGLIDGLEPKLVALMIGTNNTGHRLDSPEKITLGVKKILLEIKQRLPNSRILLQAIFPRGESPSDEARVNNEKANRLLKTLAQQQNVMYVDFNQAFLSAEQRLSKKVMPDLLHPNEVGYQIWAEQLTPFIDKYVRHKRQ